MHTTEQYSALKRKEVLGKRSRTLWSLPLSVLCSPFAVENFQE